MNPKPESNLKSPLKFEANVSDGTNFVLYQYHIIWFDMYYTKIKPLKYDHPIHIVF